MPHPVFKLPHLRHRHPRRRGPADPPPLPQVDKVLMSDYGLKLAVATPFLDPDEKYINTGQYSYGDCEVKVVSSFMEFL